MPLRIVTASERMAEAASKTTIAIFGPAGIGKTSLIRFLDPASTLVLDFEAGMKSVQDWPGRSVPIRTWPDALDIMALVGGIDPAARPEDAFSADHHEHVRRVYGDAIDLSGVSTVFADSITDATRLAMQWAQGEPAAFSEKSGKPNLLGAYGLMGREVIRSLKHLQHAPAKTVIFVGGIESVSDDLGRASWQPQMEGSKVGKELPFIADQVISFDLFDHAEENGWKHAPGKGAIRAFVCRSPNPWGLPAKDRSGQLEMIEEPDLEKLLDKINRPAREAFSRA